MSKHTFKWKLEEGSGHFHPAPEDMQPSGGKSGVSVSTNKLMAEARCHNPNPLVWLLCNTNGAMTLVEGVEMTALDDTGSQISALTERFCTEMGLGILPLGDLIGSVLYLMGMEHFDTIQGIHRGKLHYKRFTPV